MGSTVYKYQNDWHLGSVTMFVILKCKNVFCRYL